MKFFVSLFFSGLACLTCAGVLVACAPKDDPPPRNGVNDVKKACDIRAAWVTPGAAKCTSCVGSAPLPACGCEQFKDFGGFCQAQEDARHAEPTCTSVVDTCTRSCPASDCGCVENCYAQAPACKPLAAALDGCVADVCSPYCN